MFVLVRWRRATPRETVKPDSSTIKCFGANGHRCFCASRPSSRPCSIAVHMWWIGGAAAWVALQLLEWLTRTCMQPTSWRPHQGAYPANLLRSRGSRASGHECGPDTECTWTRSRRGCLSAQWTAIPHINSSASVSLRVPTSVASGLISPLNDFSMLLTTNILYR